MHSRVVVLGAGASCAYRESPTGIRPPLAREIMRAYHRLDLAEKRYVLVGDIVNYVRDTRGIQPIDFASWDEDIEAFMTELDETIQRSASLTKDGKQDDDVFATFFQATRAYSQLIFLFASVFNEIQNGPISIPHALLANELGTEDTIVTFNWDTLMDRALAATTKWSPRDGYSVSPEHVFDDGWKDSTKFLFCAGTPQYLKLHGSTNWLTASHGVNPTTGDFFTISGYSMDKLFVFLAASRPYETYENRYWGPYQPFSYCYYPPNLPVHRDDRPEGYRMVSSLNAYDLPEHGKITLDDETCYSIPLIVPPVRDKQYANYGKIFAQLWNRAEAAISACRELYVIGYSFPETDVISRTMFSRAIENNLSLQRVTIVNPHPDKVRRLFLDEFNVKPSMLNVKAERFEVPFAASGSLFSHWM